MTRLFKIFAAVAVNRLDNLINPERLNLPARILLKLLPWRYLIKNEAPRGERIRLAMEALGPVFIKFGQLLSTRRDYCLMILVMSWPGCRMMCRLFHRMMLLPLSRKIWEPPLARYLLHLIASPWLLLLLPRCTVPDYRLVKKS